jgi:hypothetical protein
VYRLRKWAVYLLNNARVSLFVVTITRNVLIVFFSTHLTACLFYYMARQNEHEHNWVVGAMEWLDPNHVGVSTFARYLWSLYFATVTFATLGYGDIRAYTLPEACFLIVVVVINVFLGAYIIGTITLLVTRGDEEAARYRGRLAALQAYATANGLPKDLQSALRGHLRLHFSASEESDESVLAGMPGALRRRVLRHLYLGVIEDSWLLTGTRVKVCACVCVCWLFAVGGGFHTHRTAHATLAASSTTHAHPPPPKKHQSTVPRRRARVGARRAHHAARGRGVRGRPRQRGERDRGETGWCWCMMA